MSASEFRTERMVELLDEVEWWRAARSVAVDIQIVGGAILLLHGLLNRSTEDMDARYSSAPVAKEVARQMAAGYGCRWVGSIRRLPRSCRTMPHGKSGKEGPTAAIRLADLPTFAAVKLAAERQNDTEDLGRIANALGITNPVDLVRIAYEK